MISPEAHAAQGGPMTDNAKLVEELNAYQCARQCSCSECRKLKGLMDRAAAALTAADARVKELEEDEAQRQQLVCDLNDGCVRYEKHIAALESKLAKAREAAPKIGAALSFISANPPSARALRCARTLLDEASASLPSTTPTDEALAALATEKEKDDE